jgi:hypothetical protein
MPRLCRRWKAGELEGWKKDANLPTFQYVLYRPESNAIDYITAVLLVLWSAYNLIATKKKWPPFP